ncbi:MAG TPA: hypothetical protein VKX25_19360 [Bryobacteraceae bacterium]|jgi:hypothetical protein|nr:hypothetical protein [Bryobacteraceae bacterium]
MANQQKTYEFSERERAHFERYRVQLQAIAGSLNHDIEFICMQQGLEGPWQLKPDGSGLQPFTPPQPLPTSAQPQPNGVTAHA